MSGKRKVHTPEFKLQAVKMITEQKLSVAEVARRLDIRENLLHSWKKAVLTRRATTLSPDRDTSLPSRRRTDDSRPMSSDSKPSVTS